MVSPIKQSEFGAGVIVCLAKFSAHLENDWFHRLMSSKRWMDASPEERARLVSESKSHPHGDAARLVSDIIVYHDSEDAGLSRQIVLWMNAASDHFYDLDRTKAPAPLLELADLCLRIGHGFSGEKWNWETVEKIQQLWQDSCTALDEGMGTVPDWGQY